MTAGRNFVLHNPQSRLAGYHRNLRKRGPSLTKATKRVARALPADTEGKKGEGDMANGLTRSERRHISKQSPAPCWAANIF